MEIILNCHRDFVAGVGVPGILLSRGLGPRRAFIAASTRSDGDVCALLLLLLCCAVRSATGPVSMPPRLLWIKARKLSTCKGAS